VSTRFLIEPLSKAHKRADFSCGNHRIDSFRERLAQDVKQKYAARFVGRQVETGRVTGFCACSSSNVPVKEPAERPANQLPRYPCVPAALIGWLGQHRDTAGRGLGEILLFDAVKTVASAPIGVGAIVADTIDDKAVASYEAFDFRPSIARSRTFDPPMATALIHVSELQRRRGKGAT
jgi:hypothetical protein